MSITNSFDFLLKKLFFFTLPSLSNIWLIEDNLEPLGVLVPLLSPVKTPELFLIKECLEVWGWGLNEKSMGELLKSLGKFESFMKLMVIFAIELDDDIGFEFIELALEMVLSAVDYVNRL